MGSVVLQVPFCHICNETASRDYLELEHSAIDMLMSLIPCFPVHSHCNVLSMGLALKGVWKRQQVQDVAAKLLKVAVLLPC